MRKLFDVKTSNEHEWEAIRNVVLDSFEDKNFYGFEITIPYKIYNSSAFHSFIDQLMLDCNYHTDKQWYRHDEHIEEVNMIARKVIFTAFSTNTKEAKSIKSVRITCGRTIKVFVSQPMRGRNEDIVDAERDKVLALFKKWGIESHLFEPDIVVKDCNPYWNEKILNCDPDDRLVYLARSIQTIESADFIVFADNWQKAHGCRVEHKIAEEYFGFNVEMMDRRFNLNQVFADSEPIIPESPLSPISEIWFGKYRNTKVDC